VILMAKCVLRVHMQTRFLYWCVRVEGFQCCPLRYACWEPDADAFPLLVRAC